MATTAMVALCLASRPAAAANLQMGTSVISFSVPPGAYNPATGAATVTISRGLVAQVNTNKKWSLQMRATSANFVFTPLSGPTVSKSVSGLQLRDCTAGSLFVPSLSFTTIDNGSNTKGRWLDSVFDVIFQVTGTDPAGQYSVILEFQVI